MAILNRSMTHCDPPESDCSFDLDDGWTHTEDWGAVIPCSTHGLLAPSAVYDIDDGGIVQGDDPRLQGS